jgi:glycosyltransferase involved in cell wall biosynthesis
VTVLVEPMKILASKYPLRLKIVGACGEPTLRDTFSSIPGLEVDLIDEVAWSDPVSVSAAVSDFDIGLYPLLKNEFNEYKCGFKALEYMARSLPFVASDVSSISEIVADGADGFLASSNDAWIGHIGQLVDSRAVRERVGEAGRRKIEYMYSTRELAERFLDIVENKIVKKRSL